LQSHLKATPAEAHPKLLKELAKRKSGMPRLKKWLYHDNFKKLAIIRTIWLIGFVSPDNSSIMNPIISC
jgi:hypothetical protein